MTAESIDKVSAVRLLVHKLDDLEAQRSKLDEQIAEVNRELISLMPSLPSVDSQAGRETLNLDLGAQEIGEDAEVEASQGALPTGNKSDLAIAAVKENPRLSYADLSVALYGDASEVSKNKARSVMHFLMKKARKVQRNDDGSWSLTEDSQH